MKKTYVKPEILFENFSLSTNIAGDCEPPFVGNASRGTCAVTGTGDVSVFSDNMTGICEYTPIDLGGNHKDMYDGLCYHVPQDTNNLFNS